MKSSLMLYRRQCMNLLAVAALAPSLPAWAAWPDKPIRIVVTFPPGGSSDILARLIAEPMSKRLGQPVVIDNRPGGGGTIGGSAVAQAAADGYTFMLSNTTPIALGPFTLEKQPYDPVDAFTHVAYLGSAPLVIMANPGTGLKTLQDLEALAKKGAVNFGSGGPGSIGHIHGELMKKASGLDLVHVPYRGGAPMTTDLLAGTIGVAIDVITAYVPLFKSGQLVPLAVTSTQRSSLMPDVPTVVELGKRGLVLENFFGLSAPPKLPQEMISRMHAVANEVMALPEIKAKLQELGIAGGVLSVSAFNDFVKNQVGVLSVAVKGAGIKL
jgi:tripartite-type tricarboxylate transporter receptor subunit TctC